MRSVFNTLYVSLPEPQSQICLTLIVEYLSPEEASRGQFPVQWHSLSVDVEEHSRLADLVPAIFAASGVARDDASLRCVFVRGLFNERTRFIDVRRSPSFLTASTPSWSPPRRSPAC